MAASEALKLATDVPACPQCEQPMRPLPLEGHYGQKVPADLCPHCHLVWFDAFESVRLSGLGWVALLREMQAAMAGAETGALKSALGCPRCAGKLKPVHNLSRFGRFAALECPRRHGHLQTFSLLLAERGLVRPLSRADLAALQEEHRMPTCLNCGADISGAHERCAHCDSPLVAIDLPRLMAALLTRHGEPLPASGAQRIAWPCRGCGAPQEPSQSARCTQCHHLTVVPSVVDLRPLLDRVEPLLRAAVPRQARPHGERLRAMRGDHRATGIYRYARQLLQPEHPPTQAGVWARLAMLLGAAVLGWLVFFR